ncbi:MAG TPA: hypothetical protein VMT34_16390, partial [Aggregatilineales bacterium]|nr:hypothetical protein [Aggregatilineales bacterium]
MPPIAAAVLIAIIALGIGLVAFTNRGLATTTPTAAATLAAPTVAALAPLATTSVAAAIVTAPTPTKTFMASPTAVPSATPTLTPSATPTIPPPTLTPSQDLRETFIAQQQVAVQLTANAQNTALAATINAFNAMQAQLTDMAQQALTQQAAPKTPTAAPTILPTQNPMAGMNMTAPATQASVPGGTPTALRTFGRVTFSDSAKGSHVDSLTLNASSLPLPGEGNQYEVWLFDGEYTPFSLGKLTVKADGSGLLQYTSPKGANLVLAYAGVLITLQGADLKAMGKVSYSGMIPPAADVHIQHVIARFPDTPDHIGLLLGAIDQEDILTEHVNLLNDAPSKGSIALVKLHL